MLGSRIGFLAQADQIALYQIYIGGHEISIRHISEGRISYLFYEEAGNNESSFELM